MIHSPPRPLRIQKRLVVLTARAASGHLAYDAVSVLSLLFPYPKLPFHRVRNSVHCDIVTVPSEGGGGEKICLPGPGGGGLTDGNKT